MLRTPSPHLARSGDDGAVPVNNVVVSQPAASQHFPYDAPHVSDPASVLFADYTAAEWVIFLQSQEYFEWYEAELARGAFDGFIFNGSGMPVASCSGSAGATVKPAELAVRDSDAVTFYPGFPEDAVPTCYDTDSTADSSDGDDDEDLVGCQIKGDDHAPDANGGAVRIKACNVKWLPTAVEPPSPLAIPFINNSDLNNLIVLEEFAGEDVSDELDGDNSSDEEEDCRPEIQPADVQRHYWNRTNLKYTFSHAGRKYYMSAENMHARFRGVPYALKTNWEDKRPGSISAFRIMEYFAAHGHLGPLRTPLYPLLPRRLYRMLMDDAKHMFF